MADELRIDLRPDEQFDSPLLHGQRVIGFYFEIKGGRVVIDEIWNEKEETWAAGQTVHIPARVWLEAAAWIAERLTADNGMTAAALDFDLKESLKAVLFFWGPDGAQKVTKHVQMARAVRDSRQERT